MGGIHLHRIGAVATSLSEVARASVRLATHHTLNAPNPHGRVPEPTLCTTRLSLAAAAEGPLPSGPTGVARLQSHALRDWAGTGSVRARR